MCRILILLVIASLGALFSAAGPVLEEHELENLDAELRKVPQYDMIKYARIDSLKSLFNMAQTTKRNRVDISFKLGHEYMSFISDSSLVYFRKSIDIAEEIRDSAAAISGKIAHVKVLGISGFYHQAICELESLEQADVPAHLLFDLYDSARQLYDYMLGLVRDSNTEYSDLYFRKSREYRNKMLLLLPKDDPLYKFYYAEVLQDKMLYSQSRDLLMSIYNKLPQGDALTARVASALGGLAKTEGKMDEAAHYWALSAVNDIMGSIKENTSIQYLANYLYAKGDIERAYNYICVSIDDANFCNARLRNMEISKNMPLINSAYKSEIKTQNSKLKNALIIETILAIGLVITVILILYQMRRLSAAKKSLRLSNSIKEEYMGHFLDLCSIYMERLASFNKVVARKVSTGQTDDLLKITKSAKFAEDQNKIFYENFDSAFLHIYPTFVDEFNALLIPQERIEVKELGKLTMELRIFAFLRLGIDDSNKIASFLHYSVNTIYTYRNKIRNKAINRDTFDDDVRKIGAVKE